jgi:hypothetical protein
VCTHGALQHLNECEWKRENTHVVRFIEMQENIHLADGKMLDEWKIHEAFR